MSIFFDLFSGGNRHRSEELRRLENTREEEAQGEPGRGPIDLNSGTVLIRIPGTQQPQDSVTDVSDAVEVSDTIEDGDAAASEEDGGV